MKFLSVPQSSDNQQTLLIPLKRIEEINVDLTIEEINIVMGKKDQIEITISAQYHGKLVFDKLLADLARLSQ